MPIAKVILISISFEATDTTQSVASFPRKAGQFGLDAWPTWCGTVVALGWNIHYTNKSSAKKIMESGEIVAKDNGRVYVEDAAKKALSPKKAESTHKIKPGKGNSYVETDVPSDSIEMVKNPLTGKQEMTVKGNVKLDNADVKHR